MDIAALQHDNSWRGRLASLLFTGGIQAGIQMLAFLGGLIVIRLLPVDEYAYYTIANATLGTLLVLTDSGISQSVMAQGGKVWENRTALGGVVAGGLVLRRRFAAFATVVSMPALYFLLKQQGATSVVAILVTASIIPLFLSSLTSQLLEVVPRLHQRLVPLQRIQLSAAGLRLVAMSVGAAVFPHAWLASLGAGLAQSWSTWRVRRLAGSLANLDVPPDHAISKDMIRQVRRMAPGAIYYAFAGQINIWLISVFGNTEAVAQVGALGRLAMAFNIVGAGFSLICVPRFARLQSGHGGDVLRRFWSTQAGLMALLAAVVIWVACFPAIALAVLGPDYASLTGEVVLTAAGGALALLSGSAYAMAAARGIVMTPWFVVPFAIFVQALLIATLPMSTVAGVLWLSVLTNLTFWLMHALYLSHVAAKKDWTAGKTTE